MSSKKINIIRMPLQSVSFYEGTDPTAHFVGYMTPSRITSVQNTSDSVVDKIFDLISDAAQKRVDKGIKTVKDFGLGTVDSILGSIGLSRANKAAGGTNTAGNAFLGTPTDPAPGAWNRHAKKLAGGQGKDYFKTANSFYTYGGPVSSIYSAINGLHETVNEFIGKTKEESLYFKEALARQAQQIHQYISFLNDPIVRRGFGISSDALGEMLSKVNAAVQSESVRVRTAFAEPIGNVWDILRPLIDVCKQDIKQDADESWYIDDLFIERR